MQRMDAQEIINYIATAPKKTPVKAYIRLKEGASVDLSCAEHVFGTEQNKVVFGDWALLGPVLEQAADAIDDLVVENDGRNTGVPMLDKKGVHARIEPGAIIRDKVEVGDNAVIMMGAVINIGSIIGDSTMIDMGAILGGRATVGKNWTTCSSAPTPWCSRAFAWAGAPSWQPAPSSSRTCPPAPSWPAFPPGSSSGRARSRAARCRSSTRCARCRCVRPVWPSRPLQGR